ncbi:hypothetical protein SELMODRAFT_125835 [Selaginella moellendorffii]|uniref:Xylulose kinase n=1 Tax=Selaginella moellendorffii TaxID=88036 RepID=D8SVH9_SELML|nr:hypothetical protein SELMODRAFT_125835 [Selaginella moellendorffii]
MPSSTLDLLGSGLFLGFDSSTQSLKATAVDDKLRVVASQCVNFDSELPQYGTRGGVLHREKEGSITAPCIMWVEALELLLGKLAAEKFPFHKVVALSGSGQQHGSVYWRKGAAQLLGDLDVAGDDDLAAQLRDRAFSTHDSPVWMDSSTTQQCRAIEEALGGAASVASLTGSRAYERFTGPQIRKLYERQPEVYGDTERISLVSSFMASIFLGRYASIDYSDAAGMNLMDLEKRCWSHAMLEATAPGLEQRLGPLAASHEVAGNIHPFFVTKYGFPSECLVVHWSGDNPCSLAAGLALEHPGDIAISLGTSDTLVFFQVFGVTRNPQPGLEGHVFPNPVDVMNSYMAMLCYKNGSLTREDMRDRYAGGSWQKFNLLLQQSPPLNEGKLVFFYKEPEILPPLPAGMQRYVVDGDSVSEVAGEFSPSEEVRGLVEGQFASMRAHAERIGLPMPPNRIIATGGASANQQLVQLMANVFACDVYQAQQTDSASAGAAIRAAQGWASHRQQRFVPLSELIHNTAAAPNDSAVFLKLVASAQSCDDGYERMAATRAKIEQQLLLARHSC